MMFDFNTFYQGLLKEVNEFNPYSDYFSTFPSEMNLRFKSQTLRLLQENVKNKDAVGLECTVMVIFRDGADKDFTGILLTILDEDWHELQEDIVEVLEMIKDPKSVEKLYEVAVNVPEYDEMRALAKKCMWALRAIGTKEAIDKLKLLQSSTDPIISENAKFHLDNINKN